MKSEVVALRIKSPDGEIHNLYPKTLIESISNKNGESLETVLREYVAGQIADSSHLVKEIVTEIPTVENAKENVIYMIKDSSVIGNDKYKEYQLIGNEIVCIGDTSIDLTNYVDINLLSSVLDEYASNETLNTKVTELQTSISNTAMSLNKNLDNVRRTYQPMIKTAGLSEPNFGLVWILYTNNLMTGFSNLEDAARQYATYDFITTHILNLNSLAPEIGSGYGYTDLSNQIVKRAKELNPIFRRVEYIQIESERRDFSYEGEYAYLNSDGSWEGSTADLSGCTRIFTIGQIRDWLRYFKSAGADGVFYDDWGYDWSIEHISYQMGYDSTTFSTLAEALNQKWIDLIEVAHEEGLFVVTNGGFQSDRGDWYTHFDERDIICYESNIISSYQDQILNGQNTLYNYYTNFYINGKCKAQTWSMNYLPSGCSGEYLEKVRTYLINMALASGARYVSIGTSPHSSLPDYVYSLIDGDKTITKINDYAYRITTNKNFLEVYKDELISGTLTEEMIDKCYAIYNGHKFRNAYLDAPSVAETVDERVNTVENTIANMTSDTKRNAVSYWRMKIDDWGRESVSKAYTNLIETIGGFFVTDKGVYSGDVNKFTVTFNNNGWNKVALFSIDFSDSKLTYLRGKTVEFGVMKRKITMVNESSVKPNPAYRYTTSSNPNMQLVSLADVSVSSILLDNKDGWCYTMTIPEDCLTLEFAIWESWFRAYDAGTIECEGGYFIDVNEHQEEYTKSWYTTLIDPNMNKQSAGKSQYVLRNYRNTKVYDVEVYSTDPWGWSYHAFTSDEVIALRGKTIEFGCFECSTSDENYKLGDTGSGGRNIKFGVGISNNTTNPEPKSYFIKQSTTSRSDIWKENNMHFVRFTIPVDAVGISVGFQSYGIAKNTTVYIKGLYMYDVNEEGLVIRGVDSYNSSLAICRVREDIEEADPSNINNALYISDKGRVWMIDGSGEEVIISDDEALNTKMTEIGNEVTALHSNRGMYPPVTIDLTDTTVYSEDTWYPCASSFIPAENLRRINCYTILSQSGAPSWATSPVGFTCNLDLLVRGSGHGRTNAESIMLDHSYKYCNESPLGYTQFTNDSKCVFYLRGGGKYYIQSDDPIQWTVYTETLTIGEQTASPQTTYPGIMTIRANMRMNLDECEVVGPEAYLDYVTNSGYRMRATVTQYKDMGLYSVTDSKWIVRYDANGKSQLNGGVMSLGQQEVLNVENASGVASYISFTGTSGVDGTIGFEDKEKPVVIYPDGTKHNLIHAGNFSDYAPAKTDILNNTLWTGLTTGVNLNDALGKYRTNQSVVIAALVNCPVSRGEITVEWFPTIDDNSYGVQVLKHNLPDVGVTEYVRSKRENGWGEWKQIATSDDLNEIRSTSRGSLSEAGWYRVAKYAGSEGAVHGGQSNSCELFIKRMFSNTNNENHHLLIMSKYFDFQQITSLYSWSQYHLITKARYTIEGTVAYLEIYYNSSEANGCVFEITHGKDYDYYWQAITPTLTSETIEGVTVTRVYNIPANASPVTDLDIGYLEKWKFLPPDVYTSIDDIPAGAWAIPSAVCEAITNMPEEYVDHMCYAIVGKVTDENFVQLINPYSSYTWFRYRFGGTYKWSAPIATTTDLNNCLPLDGSRPMHNILYIGSGGEEAKTLVLQNSKRKILHQVSEDGRYALYDNTNEGSSIIASDANCNTTFYGTATGNLPLSGGTIEGKLQVTNSSYPAIIVNTTASETTTYPAIEFRKDGTMLGALAMTTEKELRLYKEDYSAANYVGLLTTGNSKAVVDSASAPTDTSGNTLWYDTVNKVLKRYVDGAWQQ